MNVIQKAYILLADQNKKLPIIMMMFIIASIIDLVGIGLVAPYVGFILDNNLQNIVTESTNRFFLINLNQQEIILILGALILLKTGELCQCFLIVYRSQLSQKLI